MLQLYKCFNKQYQNTHERDYISMLLDPYHGVEIVKTAVLDKYKTHIHVNGNFVIGTYSTIERADIYTTVSISDKFVKYLEALT